MGLLINPKEDFRNVLDGFEIISYFRRGAVSSSSIQHAWRYKEDLSEVSPSDGIVKQQDATWQIAATDLLESPELGDRIVDANSISWTVRKSERKGMNSRWVCQTRNLEITNALVEMVDVEVLLAGVWTLFQANVRSKIQPIEVLVTGDGPTIDSTQTYHLYLEEELDLDHTKRIKDQNGNIYRIVESIGMERIDALPMVVMVKE